MNIALPANCVEMKQGSGHQGRNYKTVPGVHGYQCAKLCADDLGCVYWLDRASKGCIMKTSYRNAKKNTDYTRHGTCTHDRVVAKGCTNLGQQHGFRGTRVGHNTDSANYVKSVLVMTPALCMQKCANLQDAAGNALCKYWIVHNKKGCLMYRATRGKVMKRPKGFLHHGTCNGGTADANMYGMAYISNMLGQSDLSQSDSISMPAPAAGAP